MCVNYTAVTQLELSLFALSDLQGTEWQQEVWLDYLTPILVRGANGERQALVANYGLVPQHHKPPGVPRLTNSAGGPAGRTAHHPSNAGIRCCYEPQPNKESAWNL